MRVRGVAFAVAAFVAVASAGCGNDTTSSSGDGTPSTIADAPSAGLATPSAACASAMTDFANAWNLSDDEQKPYISATFAACSTAGEWNAAAEQHRNTDPSVDGPAVIGGPNVLVDNVRRAFCQGIDPVPPACSDQ